MTTDESLKVQKEAIESVAPFYENCEPADNGKSYGGEEFAYGFYHRLNDILSVDKEKGSK